MGASASQELQLAEEQLAVERQQEATREANRVAQRQSSPHAGRSTSAERTAFEKMGKRARHQIDWGMQRAEVDAGFAVIVIGAKGLRDADWWGTSDPYCDVRCGKAGSTWAQKGRPGQKRSRVLRDTENPEWRLGFVAPNAVEEVTIRVFDADSFFTEDDPLGEATVAVTSHTASRSQISIPLTGGPDVRGTVQVQFGPVEMLEREPSVGPWRELVPLAAMSEYKEWRAADVSAAGPLVVGTAPLPPTLRGVFWLQNQGDSSSIMSFGKTNDGGGVGTGALTEGNPYLVRCGGDRAWAFSDKGRSYTLVNAVDLCYKFFFDDLENPRRCQIFPHAPVGLTLDWTWLLDFDMHVVQSRDYPSSVVWRRVTHALGREVPSEQYDLVQILDENGNRLQPAFFEFTAVMKTRYCGTTPGVIHYRDFLGAAGGSGGTQAQPQVQVPAQQQAGFGGGPGPAAAVPPERDVRALCCAVCYSYTPGAGISELPGAVADTQSVASGIRARYPGASVRLLIDETVHDGKAAKREVLNEVDRLVANIDPAKETLLFFQFAGHGSATRREWRRSGEEIEQGSNFLVTLDNLVIANAELFQRLVKPVAKKKNVTLVCVVDCCRCTGAALSLPYQWDPNTHAWSSVSQFGHSPKKQGAKIVAIAGSVDEQALGPHGQKVGGLRPGVMTSCFKRALASGVTSIRDLMASIRGDLAKMDVPQTSQLSCSQRLPATASVFP